MFRVEPVYAWIPHQEWLEQVDKNISAAISAQYSNYRSFRSHYGGGGYDNDYFDVKDSAHASIDAFEALRQQVQALCQGAAFEQTPIAELRSWLQGQLSAPRFQRLAEVLPDEQHCRRISNLQDYPARWQNEWGMEFVLIYPGEYLKGRSVEEIHTHTFCSYWEGMNEYKNYYDQRHRVRLTRAYYLQITPVTQQQWQAITNINPAYFKGPDLPVENISLRNCRELLKRMNVKLPAEFPFSYRLPTDAEWEYACRAGEKDNFADWQERAWSDEDAELKTHPVATKKPNDWGLYDMLGNVWEWVEDATYYHFWGESPDRLPVFKDPRNNGANTYRGGSWKTTSPQRFIGERPFTTADSDSKHLYEMSLLGKNTKKFYEEKLNKVILMDNDSTQLPPDIGCRLAIEL